MKKPIIHAYFLCYNEANILPHLLKHYLSFCDKVHIMDNYSTDSSIDIINSFDNTEIIQYDSNSQVRDDIYIQIKNNCWKRSIGIADYVIVGDADEFLYHEDIKNFIQKSFDDGVTIFRPEGYHMIADENFELNNDDNILEKVTQGLQVHVLDKLMMFNCNKLKEINYSFGCHNASPVGEVNLSDNKGLKMLHYKFLGIKDHLFRNNIRRERLSDFNKKYGLGSYYLYTDIEVEQDYKNYLNRRTKVI